MKNIVDFFDKIEQSKLSHAYIISNTCLENIKEELEKVISKYIFKSNIKLDNNVDIVILNANEIYVTKDDIKELIKNVSTTSQFNNKKVYIIDGCEMLNGYSYNAILKTLEEPSDNVYAFLITNNIEKVKETIVSRCQKVHINSSKVENFDDNIINIGNEIDKLINNKKNIYSYKKLYTEIIDSRELENIIDYLLDKYFDIIKNIDTIDDENKKKIENYSKRIIVLNNMWSLVNSNLNKNLTIDRLMIEMWRI